MTLPDQAPTGPYGAWAAHYWSLGWRGVLPLPPGQKKYPHTGWTGRGAPDPSYADLYTWAETEPNGNIALRLPRGVLGLDIDAYGEKLGGATILSAIAAYGPLPATWRSSARDDGVSGIRFYRIPEGLHWPGELPGGGVELIQHVHRYAVVAPSTNPQAGGAAYRWYDPDGIPTLAWPRPDQLPWLPERWVQALTGGQEDAEVTKLSVTVIDGMGWMVQQSGWNDLPCPVMEKVGRQHQEPHRGSEHDRTMKLMYAAVRYAEGQHPGGRQVLNSMRIRFLEIVTAPGRGRDRSEAEREWDRMFAGAVGGVQGDPGGRTCDCYGQMTRELIEMARPGPTVPQAAPDVPGEALPVDRPTWASVDLSRFVNGTYRAPEPDLMPRTDERCLFYSGQTHSVHGESESGKSLVVQIAAALQLRAGNPVLYVDFESDAAQIVGRMLQLGCTPEQIVELFDYRQPERSPRSPEELSTWVEMMGRTYTLAVIDGVTDALGVFGMGSGSVTKDNDAITVWARQFPRLLAAKTGAAVVMVDHVVKNGTDRGRFAIGGQAKMAALTGAAYSAQMTRTLGIGLIGEVTLRIGKDRPGGIRPYCGPFHSVDQTQEAARIEIDSTGDVTNWVIIPPDGAVDDEYRLTALMERISDHLGEQDGPVSLRAVRRFVMGRFTTISDAMAELVDRGHVSREPLRGSSGGGGMGHRLVKPYLENALSGSHVVPGSQVVPGGSGNHEGVVVPEVALPEGEPRPPRAHQEHPQIDVVVPQ